MKAARSFFSLFLGWAAACSWDYLSRLCSAGGVDLVLFLSPIHAGVSLLGWLLFGLPVVYLTPQRLATRWYVCVSVGIALCLLAYLLLVCTWFPEAISLYFPWFPGIIGAVGGLAFWLLGTPAASRVMLRSQSVSIAILYLLPGTILIGFVYCFWPALMTLSPYTAYRFGDTESRTHAEYEVFTHVKVGDTYSDLHRKYPAIFHDPYLGSSGTSKGSFAWSYHITFDDTRSYVTKVSVERDAQ